jgi:MFS transporter, DHA2 family, methylenomycin A resistance protein
MAASSDANSAAEEPDRWASVADRSWQAASGRLTARFGPRLPMIAGMCCSALISLTGAAGPLSLILAGSVILGFCSLAMPAMTAVCLGAVGAGRAGLASGVLNAAIT